MVKNLPIMQVTWDRSLGWEVPIEKKIGTHSSILPGEFHGQRSLVGYSPWGPKESDMTEKLTLNTTSKDFPGGTVEKNPPAMQQMQEMWVRSMEEIQEMLGRSPGGGNGNPLQYSSWRIPWTEEPGRLPSMGLQRVGQDWVGD